MMSEQYQSLASKHKLNYKHSLKNRVSEDMENTQNAANVSVSVYVHEDMIMYTVEWVWVCVCLLLTW